MGTQVKSKNTMRIMSRNKLVVALVLFAAVCPGPAWSQTSPVRGSIVEDRAARKLLEAGDARLEADETEKALEIWKSVIERYPRSKVRFDAHMKIGSFSSRKRVPSRRPGASSRPSISKRTAIGINGPGQPSRPGSAFSRDASYGQSFKTLRRVIEDYPARPEVNDAYYYIGLGHFKLGHYSRAIEALEKVGTALNEEDAAIEKVEAGKRLYVKVNDQDLAVLEPGETVTLRCKARSGDEEEIVCHPLGRQVKVILGSLPTALGSPDPGNGRLEVQGNDKVDVFYVDAQTADKKFDQDRLYTVNVVGTAIVQIKDGSFGDTLAGVVIGKSANLEVVDADFDRSHQADRLFAFAEIWREKTGTNSTRKLPPPSRNGIPSPPKKTSRRSNDFERSTRSGSR